jgi:MFS transporter, CP family, cyanate transporter
VNGSARPAAPTRSGSSAVAPDRSVPAWVFVLMVAAIGLNLRASLGALPPLLDHVRADFRLSSTEAGLLTSLPVLCMGLGAPLGQRLGMRAGPELTTGLALLVLSAAGLLRLLPLGPEMLFASSALAGGAMGSASALMPALIGHHIADLRGLVTGIYSAGLAAGVGIAAGTAVPLEHSLGGWRPALATGGAAAAVTGVGWLCLCRRLRGVRGCREDAGAAAAGGMPWRSRTAWWVTIFSASQMLVGISGLAWISPYYLTLGMSAQEAARQLVVFQAVQLVTMIALPAIADHVRDRRPLLLFAVVCSSAGLAALALDPLGLAIPCMLLFGAGVGGGSTLGLVLIVDTARGQAEGARLSAMVLLISFLSASVGPLLLGALLDATGGFGAGFAVLLTVSLIVLPCISVYRPGRVITGWTPVRAVDAPGVARASRVLHRDRLDISLNYWNSCKAPWCGSQATAARAAIVPPAAQDTSNCGTCCPSARADP